MDKIHWTTAEIVDFYIQLGEEIMLLIGFTDEVWVEAVDKVTPLVAELDTILRRCPADNKMLTAMAWSLFRAQLTSFRDHAHKQENHQ